MNIAAYCRVSTDKEEQISSLVHQKEFFVGYAQRNGHTLFRLYADEGITGTSLKKRDAFNRLMQDARYGLFQAVVVKDISRLARNTVDFLVSIRELKAMGINVIFLNANMDSMGDSEFILTLFSAMAQEESANLSKRTKFGKQLNAQKGRVPQKLFGYDRVDNFTLAVNPEEAGIVRKIFSLYIDRGMGCRSISLTLNRDGDKTKQGNEWNAQGIRRVLTNPIYKGTLVNHKYEIENFLTGKQIKLPDEARFYHQRPEWAVVSSETFQKAQEIMASRRIRYDSGEPFREGRYSSKHLFSTLIKCDHCGRSFTRKTYTYVNTRIYWRCITNDQYTSQHCDNNIPLNEPELIQELRSYFASRISDKEALINSTLDAFLQHRPKQGSFTPTARETESRRNKLLSKKERYQELYANDLISLAELKEKLAAIRQELQALDARLEEIHDADGRAHSLEQELPRYRERILGFLRLETVTNADLRRLLDHICVSRNGNIQVVFKKWEPSGNI